MDDEAAFMALVLANSQSELSPLERGRHALKSGLDTKAYAEAVHEDRLKVQRRVMAARVAAVFNGEHAALAERWFQLVETTRSNAGRLKDVREVQAAEVWKTYNPGCGFPPDKIPAARVLAELHVAARWLWSALLGHA
jgi:hypothetical protein